MIPKKIWTVWLGDMPEVIRKCIESQKIEGYEHHVITLENMQFMDSLYIQQAMSSTYRDGIKYCKMSDYLRMRYLYKYGGIYLDADCSILPGKNFNDLLNDGMFAARENNGFIGSATVASRPEHPFVKRWIETVEKNFRGDDALNFESSMEILTNGYIQWSLNGDFKLYDTHYFYPYDHQAGTVVVTKNTRTFHHFTKTWTNAQKDVLPRVSIVLPTLGREDGLRKCLLSIDRLYYPKHLIETIVLDGPGTVPEKVDKGLKDSTGEYICYLANDTEIEPSALYEAIRASRTANKGLVSFNTGVVTPDKGNINEHFIIRRDLVSRIGGQIFDTRYIHLGVDNLLWLKASRINEAMRCESAIVNHYHFSTGKSVYDEVYDKVWNAKTAKHDRDLLAKDIEKLNDTHTPTAT